MDNNEITEENPVTVKRLSRFNSTNIFETIVVKMISLCSSALFALFAYGMNSFRSHIKAGEIKFAILPNQKKFDIMFCSFFIIVFAGLSIVCFAFALGFWDIFFDKTPFKGEMKFKHEGREYTLHLDFSKDRSGYYKIERCYIAFPSLVTKDKNEKIEIPLESSAFFKDDNVKNTRTFNDLKISSKFNWDDFTKKTGVSKKVLEERIVEFSDVINNSKEFEKNKLPPSKQSNLSSDPTQQIPHSYDSPPPPYGSLEDNQNIIFSK